MAEALSYEVLEYLESDGYQYIDTGLSAPANTIFKARIAVIDNSFTSGLIGTRASTVISAYSYNLFIINKTVRIDPIGNGQVYVNISLDVPFNVECTPDKIVVNEVAHANAVAKKSCGKTFYLFNFNNNGDGVYAERGTPQRLYSFRLWHGETLVADMLPARKDGVCCLFDKVTQTFFYNAGSGEFIAGPRVCLVKDWMLVEYEGVNDDDVDFSADSVNEGLDREISVSFVDKSRTIVVERTVRQEGMRDVFMASDGAFILSDGGTFNVMKNEL